MDGIEQVMVSLTETIAWCAPPTSVMGQADPRCSLRDTSLRPPSFSFMRDAASRQAAINALIQRRVERLRLYHRYPHELTPDLAGGRLLLYLPDDTLQEGASELASKGFFDVSSDEPPWDTWVCFDNDAVLSWVPPRFLELADAGVRVNTTACVRWATGEETPLMMRELRLLGLL